METGEPTFNGILEMEASILNTCRKKVRELLEHEPTGYEITMVNTLYITMTQENRKLRQRPTRTLPP